MTEKDADMNELSSWLKKQAKVMQITGNIKYADKYHEASLEIDKLQIFANIILSAAKQGYVIDPDTLIVHAQNIGIQKSNG